WYDGASERSTNSIRGANSNLDFLNRKEVSLNLRTSVWDRLITADVSFFVNTMEGMIIQPSTIYPSYFWTYYLDASFIPYANYNNHQRTVVDFKVAIYKNIGDVGLSVGFSGMYHTSKATRLDENYEDEYQNG